MNLVVLAAGPGTRFYPITKTIPKAMVRVNGKPLIEHCLASFKDSVTKIIVVVNDETGPVLQAYMGNTYEGISVEYAVQPLAAERGTWFAMLQAAPHLNADDEYFIVSNCDDVYDPVEIEAVINQAPALSMGITKTIMPKKYLGIRSEEGFVTGFVSHIDCAENETEDLFSNGLYIISKKILSLHPVQIAGGEYGLPQTILKNLDIFSCRAIPMKAWRSVNKPSDILKMNA